MTREQRFGAALIVGSVLTLGCGVLAWKELSTGWGFVVGQFVIWPLVFGSAMGGWPVVGSAFGYEPPDPTLLPQQRTKI